MLHLIIGASGTGKSSMVLEQIKQRAEQGLESFLVVPEQFTSATERRLFATLGDKLSGYVTSASFSSLARDIMEAYGGTAIRTLDDAGRAVLVRRALAGVEDQLKYYKKYCKNVNFCQLAAQTIDELKSAGIRPEQVEQLAGRVETGQEKLRELALIYAAYQERLANTALDPTDRVELAAQYLQPDFFAGKAVFLDEFDTFNASKRALLSAMLSVTDVTVCLCCTNDKAAEYSLFSGAEQLRQQLHRLAHQVCVKVRETPLTEDYRHKNEDMRRLALVAMERDAEEISAQHITLLDAENRREEAHRVMAAILKLRREQKVPFGKMAIICRTMEDYLPALRYEARLAEVPIYCDETESPEHTAPAMAATAAIGILRGGTTTANVLALVRTGLCGLTPEQRTALENYAYTWEPYAAQWTQPFTNCPSGFAAQMKDSDRAELELAEQARAFLMEKITPFVQECRGADCGTVTRALYRLLVGIGVLEQLLALKTALEREKGEAEAEKLVQQWEKLMQLLDDFERLLGQETLTAAEYGEHFALLLRTATMGSIPQMADSVILTSAGRMRLDGVQAAFVLGLAEGEFPQMPGDAGLLTHLDREAMLEASSRMVEQGEAEDAIELPDYFDNKLIREKICFYRALTVSSNWLWLSWPGQRGLVPMCSALQAVVETLHPQPPMLDEADLAATRRTALQQLGTAWQMEEYPRFAALYAALRQSHETDRELAAMGLAVDGMKYRPEDTGMLEKVLRQDFNLSPSQMSSFYACPFSYFLNYVLKVRPRKKAKLTVDQTGTLVHWVLEQLVRTSAVSVEKWNRFLTMEDEERNALVDRLVEQYVQLNLPGAREDPQQDYQLDRILKNMRGLAVYLQREFSQTRCRPVQCELNISRDGIVRPLSFTDGAGHRVHLIGQVDRVDVLEQNGKQYLRVVDYKTGSKEFSLDEVNNGQDCQMLCYLYTLQKQGLTALDGTRIQDAIPAGVLYLQVDPSPGQDGTVKYTSKGLLLNNSAMLLGMEPEGQGVYLPVKYKNDGELQSYSLKNVASHERLEDVFQHLEQLIVNMADSLYHGYFDACPLQDTSRKPMACRYCDYAGICHHKQGEPERALVPANFKE